MTEDLTVYKCKECAKVFLSELALRGHRSAHAEEVAL